MARKSSKTAHVLNLLTSGSNVDELLPENEQQEDELSVAKLIQKQPPVNKKARPKKSAAPKPSPAAEPEPVQESPAPEPPAPTEQTANAPPAESPEPAKAQETAPTSPPAAIPAAPEPAAAQENREDLYELVNLAELAIKEKAASVIERMNLCNCPKCKQDVIAFALNHSPSRYLPQSRVGNTEIDRYLADHGREVTAALVKSCIKVKATPRH